jgi:hypothetical protein
LLLLAGSAAAAHPTFPAGSPFSGATDVITGSFDTSCGAGPVGVLDDGTHFFVTDACTGTTYRLPSSGGSIDTPDASSVNGLTHGIGTQNGVYYGLNYGTGLHSFDPGTLAATGVTAIPGSSRDVVADPLSSDVYVSTDSGIFRVQDPTGTPSVTPFAPGNIDGMTFSDDGQQLYGAASNGHVVGFDRAGTNDFDVDIGHPGDGIALAAPDTTINGTDISGNLFVNSNDGTIEMIAVHDANAVSVVASGGTRGDFMTVGPGGCLFATQLATVEKLTPCFLSPPTPPRQSKLNVITDLQSMLPSGSKKIDKGLHAAIRSLTASVLVALWLDDAHLIPKTAQKVFGGERKGAGSIVKLFPLVGPDLLSRLTTDATTLATADRNLAQAELNDAIAAEGNAALIAKAQAALAAGDAISPRRRAIAAYGKVWQIADRAMPRTG